MTDQSPDTAPIACTLGAGEFQARVAGLAALNAAALRHVRRDDLVLELTYAPGARDDVLEMVRRERECCGFLGFNVRDDALGVRVVVTAPEAARAAADTLFESFASGAAGAAAGCGCGGKSASLAAWAAAKSARPATPPKNGPISVAAMIAAAGALACGACCVLPFALPAALLAMSGGVLVWVARAMPWVTGLAAAAVMGGWIWLALRRARTRRRPGRVTDTWWVHLLR